MGLLLLRGPQKNRVKQQLESSPRLRPVLWPEAEENDAAFAKRGINQG
jgi:hypothetical protein